MSSRVRYLGRSRPRRERVSLLVCHPEAVWVLRDRDRLAQDDKNRGTGPRTTEGCHPQAGIWADCPRGGSQFEAVQNQKQVLACLLGTTDKGKTEVLPSGDASRSPCSGRQTKAKSRSLPCSGRQKIGARGSGRQVFGCHPERSEGSRPKAVQNQARDPSGVKLPSG